MNFTLEETNLGGFTHGDTERCGSNMGDIVYTDLQMGDAIPRGYTYGIYYPKYI